MDARTTYFEDVGVGSSHSWRLDQPIDRMHLVRYAGSSGDFNPIHLDDEFAQSAGYDRVFGHGMLTAGLLSRFVTDWLGVGTVRRYAIQFRDRVALEDVLTFAGTVTGTGDADDPAVEVRLDVSTQDGRTLLRGEATALLPRRRPEER